MTSLRYLRRWNKFLHFFLGGGCLEKEFSSKSFPTPARPFIAVKTPVYFFQKENTLLHQRRRSRAANIEAYSLTLFFCSVLYNNVHHHKLHINYISILFYTYLLLSKLYGILNSNNFTHMALRSRSYCKVKETIVVWRYLKAGLQHHRSKSKPALFDENVDPQHINDPPFEGFHWCFTK